jgi:hypothetical protein
VERNSEILDLVRASQDNFIDPRIAARSKRSRRKRGVTIVAAGLVVGVFSLVTPALAIFGFGDIVFDPSSYAALGEIMSSNASVLTKTIEIMTQTIKIAEDGFATLQIAQDMAVMMKDKSAMKTKSFKAIDGFTANKFGGTTDWDAVLSGDLTKVAGAWKKSTVEVKDADTDPLANEGSESNRLASLNTLEAMDRAAAVCMSTIGQSRQNTNANEVARAALQRLQTSLGKSDNSTVALLGQVNLGSMFSTNELVGLNQHGSCQDELKLVELKQQRDALATDLKRQGDAANSQAKNPTGLSGQATVDSLLTKME